MDLQVFEQALSDGERVALAAHPNMVREFLRRLAAADGSVFTLPLDYNQAGLINYLVQEGGPWGWWNKQINDVNFQVKGSGIVSVEFRLVPGDELKSADGNVWRKDAVDKLRATGFRFPI